LKSERPVLGVKSLGFSSRLALNSRFLGPNDFLSSPKFFFSPKAGFSEEAGLRPPVARVVRLFGPDLSSRLFLDRWFGMKNERYVCKKKANVSKNRRF
jgi:hypothetical protein